MPRVGPQRPRNPLRDLERIVNNRNDPSEKRLVRYDNHPNSVGPHSKPKKIEISRERSAHILEKASRIGALTGGSNSQSKHQIDQYISIAENKEQPDVYVTPVVRLSSAKRDYNATKDDSIEIKLTPEAIYPSHYKNEEPRRIRIASDNDSHNNEHHNNSHIERSHQKIRAQYSREQSVVPKPRNHDISKLLPNRDMEKEQKAVMVLSPYYRKLPSPIRLDPKRDQSPYSGISLHNAKLPRYPNVQSLDREKNGHNKSKIEGLPVIKRPEYYARIPNSNPYKYQQPDWWG